MITIPKTLSYLVRSIGVEKNFKEIHQFYILYMYMYPSVTTVWDCRGGGNHEIYNS